MEIFNLQLLPAKDKFYRFARSIVRNDEEAADVVQEVMAKLWEAREELARVENPEAWAMKLIRNHALNRMKSAYVRKTDTMETKSTYAYTQPGPYEKTASEDMMSHIRTAIGGLPDIQRQIVQLRDVEGYRYEEICQVLDLDLNYVKVNLFRARQALRKKLLALKMQQ